MLKFDLYLLFFLKFLHSPEDQIFMILDYIADVIRDFSGRIRDKLPLLQQGYVDSRIVSSSCAGRRRAGRRSPYDDQIEVIFHLDAPPFLYDGHIKN
jgi:hypothetical protein